MFTLALAHSECPVTNDEASPCSGGRICRVLGVCSDNALNAPLVRPRLDDGWLVFCRGVPSHDVGRPLAGAGTHMGICAACLRTTPADLWPVPEPVAPYPGNPGFVFCEWCSLTHRIGRLGRRLSREHPSYHLLRMLLLSVFRHLVWLLAGAHDEDEELILYEARPGFWNARDPQTEQ